MSDDGRRTRAEQQKLYQSYMTERGEPWFTTTSREIWREPTQAERIDRLERDLKMGKYAEMNDIVPDPMAPNDPIKDILTDLIAELRAEPGREVYSSSLTYAVVAPTRDDLVVMADHYAARLREVTGDE